jgi:hypothetical protein
MIRAIDELRNDGKDSDDNGNSDALDTEEESHRLVRISLVVNMNTSYSNNTAI